MPRYGTTPRTPVSPRDPAVLIAPTPLPPPPPAPNRWDHAGVDDLLREGRTLLDEVSERVRRDRQLATRRVLGWLAGLPADTWQDRWLLGGDTQPPGWVPPEFVGPRRWQYFTGIGVLIILGVVRPSYPWLFGNRPQHVYDAYRRRHQPDVFAELERLAAQRDGAPMHGDAALTILTRLVIYTGKDLRDLHFRDLSAYAARRPREEYREPTDAEWAEFRDHFQLRKVALGTCDRPYGTPCQHEHACLTEMILIVWGEVQVPSP